MMRILATAVVVSLLASAVLTASHLIPFNIPALCVYLPLGMLVPELGRTGDAVEIGFAWVAVKQTWVWVVLFVYHFLLFVLITTPILYFRSRR